MYSPKKILSFTLAAVALGVVVYFIIEWRKYANSPIGKALGKIFGDLASGLLWAAQHPVFAIIGIIGLALLFPVLTGIGAAGRDAIRKRVKGALEKQTNGDLDDKTLTKDPSECGAAKAFYSSLLVGGGGGAGGACLKEGDPSERSKIAAEAAANSKAQSGLADAKAITPDSSPDAQEIVNKQAIAQENYDVVYPSQFAEAEAEPDDPDNMDEGAAAYENYFEE